jgi:hypothetical protein
MPLIEYMPVCDVPSITQKGQIGLVYSTYMTKVLMSGEGRARPSRSDTAYVQEDRETDLSFTHYDHLYFGDIQGIHVAITIGIGARD